MADFMNIDVLVLGVYVFEEVIRSHSLAPVTTGTTLEAIGEPQALV